VNIRLLVALTVSLSISIVASMFPLISLLMPYFSFVVLFIVWSPSKKAILILSVLNSLLIYYGMFTHYPFFEAFVNYGAYIGNIDPYRVWVGLTFWVPFGSLLEVLSAYFTVKELKLVERIGK